MFVRIKVETQYCGEWEEDVYEFPDGTSEETIQKYADELADENAMHWGILGDFVPDHEEDGVEVDEDGNSEEDYREGSSDWEILDMSLEEIKERYGEIAEL